MKSHLPEAVCSSTFAFLSQELKSWLHPARSAQDGQFSACLLPAPCLLWMQHKILLNIPRQSLSLFHFTVQEHWTFLQLS